MDLNGRNGVNIIKIYCMKLEKFQVKYHNKMTRCHRRIILAVGKQRQAGPKDPDKPARTVS